MENGTGVAGTGEFKLHVCLAVADMSHTRKAANFCSLLVGPGTNTDWPGVMVGVVAQLPTVKQFCWPCGTQQ